MSPIDNPSYDTLQQLIQELHYWIPFLLTYFNSWPRVVKGDFSSKKSVTCMFGPAA
jgi:hypothetical protein